VKNSNFNVLLICISFCVFFNTNSFARSYDDIIESKVITIAVYRDFVPFSYQENGEDKGVDIEISKYIAKQLGVDLKIRWMSSDESVEDDLRNNIWKGDLINRTVADIMLRVPYDRDYSMMRDDVGLLVHEQVHMFAPYHTESWKIVFNSKKIDSVPTMAIFQYHNIGVEVDSIPQFYLLAAFNGRMRDRAKHFNSMPLAISAMQANNVDAVMGLRSQVTHYQQKLDTKTYQLAANAFPMIGRQQWDIGMAVKKDYRQLSYTVADIVEAMVKKGLIQKIFNQYQASYQIPSFYSVSNQ
jgi:ABC-type amino acid transport substrate-binding protein